MGKDLVIVQNKPRALQRQQIGPIITENEFETLAGI